MSYSSQSHWNSDLVKFGSVIGSTASGRFLAAEVAQEAFDRPQFIPPSRIGFSDHLLFNESMNIFASEDCEVDAGSWLAQISMQSSSFAAEIARRIGRNVITRRTLTEQPVRAEIDDVRRSRVLADLVSTGVQGLALSNRLRDLVEIAEDSDEPFLMASAENFAKFWRRISGLRRPSLILTPDGTLRAIWKKSNNHLLELEFLSDNRLRYVFFGPSRGAHVDREAGYVDVSTIVETRLSIARE